MPKAAQKLIAEFMNDGSYGKDYRSWSPLMSVVDKIESFQDRNNFCKYNVNIQQSLVEIIDNDGCQEIVSINGSWTLLSKREVVYKAVVEFIHWYNYKESKRRLDSHRCDIISRIVEEEYLLDDMNQTMTEEDAIAYVDKHDYLVHRSIELELNPFDTIDMIERLTNKNK
jgi:hypothetical protein